MAKSGALTSGATSRSIESSARTVGLKRTRVPNSLNVTLVCNASAITIAFREQGGALEFSVTDDGVGFDPGSNGTGTGIQGIRDRISVFGGDAEIESSPGHGTIVRGRVPVSEWVR